MNLRHEWKHRLSPQDLPILRARLGAVMTPDPNAVGGSYHIRSLYFDTPADTALREKLDGVNVREKFRIRCYNKDFSLIHLEKKWKANGLGTKEKARLTPDQVRAILTGDWDWMPGSQDALIRELYVKMTLQGLRPKTIVDYTREPFVFGPGNVRVTLDYDLRTGLHCTDFLNPDCLT
ncbi:MAG: polyphosphate polymerase domain-containing protein, partial [Ruminiclostridium sp.]|nr:polyphosphate polymerase domain-containing protein [Ruminiclostridium sp.]